MGMTMTQKILAAHAGLESVKAGQLIMMAVRIYNGANFTEINDEVKEMFAQYHFGGFAAGHAPGKGRLAVALAKTVTFLFLPEYPTKTPFSTLKPFCSYSCSLA